MKTNEINKNILDTMIMGGKTRFFTPRTKNAYWLNLKVSNGYYSEESSTEDIYLYFKVFNNKITSYIEIQEDRVMRTEKIIARQGKIKAIKKHFLI